MHYKEAMRQRGHKAFSVGPQAEAFAKDLFLVFSSLLRQYSKQGPLVLRVSGKGPMNHKRLRTLCYILFPALLILTSAANFIDYYFSSSMGSILCCKNQKLN